MAETSYIHGTESEEQARLAGLNRLTNPAFLDFLELRGEERVLEVGSGLGLLAAEVAARVPHGEVVGLEYADAQLAEAQKRRAAGGLSNLHFEQGDAHHLPFADASFDVAYCRYVLEHLSDPLGALREMHRVLKPGGRVYSQENNMLMVVWDPDCPAADALLPRFVELQRRLGGDALVGKRLFALFRQTGFQEIALSYQPEIYTAGSPGFPYWVENAALIIEGAGDKLVSEKLTTPAEITQAAAEIRSLLHNPDASALFHWNRATGVK